MRNGFRLTVETPKGKCEVRADTWPDLLRLMPSDVSQVLAPAVATARKLNVNAAAQAALDVYRQTDRGFGPSSFEVAGLERDLIKCYLRRLTIADAVQWMKDHREFTTSNSSVARYWARLRKQGVAQL